MAAPLGPLSGQREGERAKGMGPACKSILFEGKRDLSWTLHSEEFRPVLLATALSRSHLQAARGPAVGSPVLPGWSQCHREPTRVPITVEEQGPVETTRAPGGSPRVRGDMCPWTCFSAARQQTWPHPLVVRRQPGGNSHTCTRECRWHPSRYNSVRTSHTSL